MSFLGSILTVGAGGIIAQALTVATIPVLSRLYSPVSFAGWALFMSVALIFASIATLRYELAVVLPETHGEAVNILAVSILAAIGVSLIAVLLIPFIGSWLLGEWLLSELKVWLWWLPVQIAATGVFISCTYWLIRTEEFKWYAFFQIALPLCTIAIQIGAAISGMKTASGLILGSIGGQCIVTAVLVLILSKKISSPLVSSISWSRMRKSSLTYRMYPLYMTPYTLVGAMRDRLVYFVLGLFGTKPEAGVYSLSARMVNMPNSLVSSAIRPVFFQKAAEGGFKKMGKTVNKTLHLLVITIIPFWILFLFHAQPLFALLFGEPWREAGLYAAVLSVPAIPMILGNWLDRSFDVLGRQRLAFFLEAIFATVSVIALLAGAWFFKSTIIAVSLQSFVITIYYSFWLLVLFRLASFPLAGLRNLLLISLGIGAVTALMSWFFMAVLAGLYACYVTAAILSCLIGTYLLREWNHHRVAL